MNYKSIILAALLVPCFIGAIDKKERQKEIMEEVDVLQQELDLITDIMKNNVWFAMLNPNYFINAYKKADAKATELEKEYDQLQKEIEQEEHVS